MTTTSPELPPVTLPETPAVEVEPAFEDTPEYHGILVVDPRILLADIDPASELTRLAVDALIGVRPEIYAFMAAVEHLPES